MRNTRRQFLQRSAAAGFTCATTVGVPLPARAAAGEIRYFDIHVHLTQQWFGTEHGPLTAEHLLRWMDAHHIEQAAVLPLVSPEAFWYPVTTDFVLRECRRHRDRLIPFCAIDPRALASHLTEKQMVVDQLLRYRDAGARGLGEHKPMLAIDDPFSMRLYEACAELNLPVLFHMDNNANMDKPGLPGLEKVLTAFPGLPFIGHGKGWWASIAGGITQADLHVGFPKGPVAPGGAIDRLMDQHHSLYGDLSSSGAHAVMRDPEFGAEFLRRRADRLLFGTDYYDLTQIEFPHFDLVTRFSISPTEAQKIFRNNAKQLLGVA